jgi:adenosine deaminase
LGATRIGHGIRAIEDASLLDRLRDMRVTLELCPTSNVRLGLVPSLSAHPVRRFLEHGVAVTVNSDDPVLLGTSLAKELAAVARAHRLSRDELLGLMTAAARAAFVAPEARAALEQRIRSAALAAG